MCDTLCALGPGGARFAKNSDRPVGEVQVVEAFPPRAGGGDLRTQYLEIPDEGAAAVVGSRPTWLWGFEHGVNEHGVAIGNERVWTNRDDLPTEPGLIGMDLVRLGLERGRSAAHAVEVVADLVERYGQGGVADRSTGEGYSSGFLVADAGEVWVLDTIGRTWAARRHDAGRGGCAISNRLMLGTDWTRGSADLLAGTDVAEVFAHPSMPTGHADRRLAVTAPAARTGALPEVSALVDVLRDHGGRRTPLPDRRASAEGEGVTVCMHLRGFEATAASMIVDLPIAAAHPVRGWACLGSPCVGVYVPFVVGSPVPACLSDPEVWEATDGLRRAVEVATDEGGPDAGTLALAAVREVLDPLEVAFGVTGAAAETGSADRADVAVREALAECRRILGT